MFDEKDRVIIAELQKDGRTPIVEISREIGLSSMGAKKRIDRILSEGIVKVKALVNIEKLGIKLAMIAMELETGSALRELIRKLKTVQEL